MRIHRLCLLVMPSLAVSAATIFALPTFGQATTSLDHHVILSGGSLQDLPAGGRQPIRQQSYTVELKTTTVQTLANGVTITRESTETRATDSQGRNLFSHTHAFPFGEEQRTFTQGHVSDPVEGTQTTWDSQSRTARVTKLPPKDQQHGCWATDAGNMRMSFGGGRPMTSARANGAAAAGSSTPARLTRRLPETSAPEDLGTATIQGMEAHGQRTTRTIPAGQMGNDKPLVSVSETWTAPGLGFELRSINDDPQSGKSTTEVVSMDLSEPPVSTFQPPDGYTVEVEELHQVPCAEQGAPR